MHGKKRRLIDTNEIKKKKKNMSQSKMTGGENNGKSLPHSSPKTELIGAVKLERIQVLLANKIGGNIKPSGNWLLDSGASHHMTGKLEFLSNIWNGESSPVGLPNGTHIFANTHGRVVLNDNFILKDVLYVPTLNCNLISVQQLIKENNCVVTFYPDHCTLQDQSTRMKIGRGEIKDEIYYFKADHKQIIS